MGKAKLIEGMHSQDNFTLQTQERYGDGVKFKGVNSCSSSFELKGKVWPYIISLYPT
jgi:hypothetical protein